MEKKRQSYNFVAVRGGSNPEGGGSTGGGANVVRINIRGVASEEYAKLDAAWDDNNPPVVLLQPQTNITGDILAAVSRSDSGYMIYATWSYRNGPSTYLISYAQMLTAGRWLFSDDVAEQSINFKSTSYD